MKKLLCMLLCTTLLIIFDSGCAYVEKSSGIFDYTDKNAQFSLAFSSDSGQVECLVTRVGDKISLKVTSPAEMESFSLEISGENCTITSSPKPTPVSKEASRSLRAIFDILYRGNTDVVSLKKSSGGLETVVSYSDGAIILGEDNLPLSLRVPTMDGGTRDVSVLWYKTEDNNNQ